MLIDDLSHIQLCDFGVSTTLRACGIADSSCKSVIASVTVPQLEEMSGKTGTYRYMVPEVFAGARSRSQCSTGYLLPSYLGVRDCGWC